MEHSLYEWKYFWDRLHYVQVETSKSVAEIGINSITMVDISYYYEGDTYFDVDKLKAHIEAKIARQGVAPC